MWLDSLRADTIFGIRQLIKNKVSSGAAILSLALAIGACTSAFRLIDAVLLRPLPVANPKISTSSHTNIWMVVPENRYTTPSSTCLP